MSWCPQCCNCIVSKRPCCTASVFGRGCNLACSTSTFGTSYFVMDTCHTCCLHDSTCLRRTVLMQTEVSYDYPRDAFLVAAGTVYSAGQQVFISYGAQNNDSLMQMYGFAEPDNPYDVYVMTSLLKWLEQLQPACQSRLDRLNKDGLLHALQEVVITRQGFGAQTLQALRYLLLPAAAGSNGAAAARAGGSSDIGLPALSPSSCETAADEETEKKIALVLVHACQQELSALSSSTSSSNGSSKSSRKGTSSSSKDAATAQAVAAAFRQEKREVLLGCLDQLTGGQATATGRGATTEAKDAQTAAA
eukprot:GHUV01019184.1.p2 GENE.GHUV01019184.1~~GHUV01019184.1.p2  ORF type:complete len:305 (+),score=80.07 GHUV01019184.1:1189-2103(+)